MFLVLWTKDEYTIDIANQLLAELEETNEQLVNPSEGDEYEYGNSKWKSNFIWWGISLI